MFRQLGIWSSTGQLHTPQDADQFMDYKEDKNGQILEGRVSTKQVPYRLTTAAATAYSTHNVQMIPFYIFYLTVWLFSVSRFGLCGRMAVGFYWAATAGRTTLNGEGLEHEDGHSHLAASVLFPIACPMIPHLRMSLE